MVEDSRSALFQRLGGDAGITAIVDDLYQRVVADATLAPFFAAVDVDAVRAHQRSLVMAVVGGPNQYVGRDLREAHRGMDLTTVHVDLVCEHLAAALEANAAAPSDVRQVVGLVTRLWAAQDWP